MEYVKQEGHFKAGIVAIGLKLLPSGDPIAVFDLEVLSQHDPSNDTWVEWPAGYRFQTEIFLLKDGQPDPDKIPKIKGALGWDGDINKLFGDTFAGVIVQSGVKGKAHNGKTYYRGTWIDHADAAIRSGSSVTAAPDAVSALAAQFNGFTKSLPANINTPPVRNTAPVAAVTPPAPVNAPVGFDAPADAPQDDVAF